MSGLPNFQRCRSKASWPVCVTPSWVHRRMADAVKFVAEKKDQAYHDLMARNLVDMETYVFVGLLLLRDAMKCEERIAIAERYILDSVSEFEKRYMRVMSNDVTLIDNKRDIIDY